jgi:NADH-quinone oxidoreductase subunit M
VLIGALKVTFGLALFGFVGMVLSVSYSLYLNRWVMFGKLTKSTLSGIQDLSRREVALFAPLIIVAIWMGVHPLGVSNLWAASVTQIIAEDLTTPHVPKWGVALRRTEPDRLEVDHISETGLEHQP